MKKMRKGSRIILAVASFALIATYFFPVWFIYLIAPQYPEGLTMQIWLSKLTGQVEIINGLNHYIGMKHISAEMFPEFKFLVYVLGFYIIYGLAVAISGSRRLLFSYLVLMVVGAIAAVVDFYLWGYNYGHNLDPTAPIKVPGLSYQPPVIGHKKLLNFDAYSYPDLGGWVVIGVAAVFFAVWFLEWKRSRKSSRLVHSHGMSKTLAGAAACLILASCDVKPEKINFGKDNCAACKMTIMDPKFGGEILTKKGRIYKFDDAHCIAEFLEKRSVELSNVNSVLFSDYDGSGNFLSSKDAVFVLGSKIKSPMGSNAAAFADRAAAEKKATELDAKTTDWATLYNVLIK